MSDPRDKKRVLVIEHSEAIAELIYQLLTDEGYDVLWLLSLSDQVDLDEVAKLHPDLLMLDLPSITPTPCYLLDLLERDPRTAQTPVVCTSTSGAAIQEALLRTNVQAAISKPFSLDDLLEVVNRSLQTRTSNCGC